MFCCLPPQTKCEWIHIKDFVEQYNEKNDKSYAWKACLDVIERRVKAPEVLLEADGQTSIVIERKVIASPPNYFSDHHKEHHLLTTIARLLDSQFGDSLYQLKVNEKSLKGRTKRQVETYADQIAQILMINEPQVKVGQAMAKDDPIPWRFRELSPIERDETMPESGIGIW